MQICPSNAYLRFIHYIHEDEKTSIYMLVNEGTEIYRGKVTFSFVQDNSSYSSHYIYDAWNNRIIEAEMEGNSMNIEIEPLKSLIVVFDDCKKVANSTNKMCYKSIDEIIKSKDIINIDNNKWKRSTCRSIEYPNFKNEKQISLPDSLEKEDPEFSGFIRYENIFNLTKDQIPKNTGKHLILCITDAYEGVEVFLNKSNLGIQIVPNFVYDISNFVVEGENKICIEVATTLEREMYKIPVQIGPPNPVPKDPSGINGEVKIINL